MAELPSNDVFFARLAEAYSRNPEIVAAYNDVSGMTARFQQRFSPDRLRSLAGTQLLEELHGRESADSLAYWLEFRNKDDFRASLFGSIRGGSALKFGIYQRADDNEWYSTDEVNNQRKILLSEAIAIAEQQRDQLLAAREVAASLPSDTGSPAYATLQRDVTSAAPDLAQLGWMHKYLHLQFPDRLDDFHSFDYAAHHLVHMGIVPPERGLYTAAATFVGVWQTFRRRRNVPMPLFTRLMNEVQGAPFSWWRIGTRSGSSGQSHWPVMRDGGYVAIGWDRLGDLREVVAGRKGNEAKEAIREALAKHYPEDTNATRGRFTNQIWTFLSRIQEGDQILACDGQTVFGIGRITGPYAFRAGLGFPHTRSIEWKSTKQFQAPDRTGLQTSVYPLDGHWAPIVAAARQLRVGEDENEDKPPPVAALTGMVAKIDEELRRKGQVILYGPPGTGKTWNALRAVQELAARAEYSRSWADLDLDQRAGILGRARADAQRIWTCTFHPSFGYEEFVEGLRPEANETGSLVFRVQRGLFRRVCASAAANSGPHFLLIDEFNRGDAARIFGELLTLLELDKRGLDAEMPYSRQRFAVPPNVFIIATMNTADRSIALIDAALRRRFGFIELLPDPAVLAGATAGGVSLGRLLATLNARIMKHLPRDGRSLQVGHSFFQREGVALSDFADVRRVLQHEVLPLLQEYCYEEPEALRRIVGDSFLHPVTRELRIELFAPGREDDLRTALSELDRSILVEESPATIDDPDAPEPTAVARG